MNCEKFTSIEETARHFKLTAETLAGWISDGLVKVQKLKSPDGESAGVWIESAEMPVLAGLILARSLGQKIDGELVGKLRHSEDQAVPFILGGIVPRGLDRDAAVAEFRRRRRALADTDALAEGLRTQARAQVEQEKALFRKALRDLLADLDAMRDDPETVDLLCQLRALVLAAEKPNLVSRAAKVVGLKK